MTTIVRDYLPSDRIALRQLCFETGALGASASVFYGDLESFADMFTAYFTDYEPHNVVVAERAGKLVGYACAARDVRAMRTPERYLWHHLWTRGVCFRRGCRAFFARAVWDVLRDGPRRPPAIDLERYPSDVHINLLAEARSDGTSLRLHRAVLDKLHAQGSPGVHGEMLAHNEAVIRWAKRHFGYTEVGAPFLIPATRGPRGERVYNVILARSLTDWQRTDQGAEAAHADR